MSDFKPGDRVVVEGVVLHSNGTFVDIKTATDQIAVNACDVRPAPYVEPELVPGMVVMSTDESDRRLWMFATDSNGEDPWFGDPEGEWFVRAELPAEIRPVFDPREVTS